MRLVTGISIASMAVSVAALALVLWLVVTEPWEPDAQPATPVVQSANEEHTQELDGEMVKAVIYNHAAQFIESEGLKGEKLSADDIEILAELPGYGCFWRLSYSDSLKAYKGHPSVYALDGNYLNYNYMEKDDVWLVNSVRYGCKNNYETWTIDDNTGAITYGRLP